MRDDFLLIMNNVCFCFACIPAHMLNKCLHKSNEVGHSRTEVVGAYELYSLLKTLEQARTEGIADSPIQQLHILSFLP